jgi:hypothetical protein
MRWIISVLSALIVAVFILFACLPISTAFAQAENKNPGVCTNSDDVGCHMMSVAGRIQKIGSDINDYTFYLRAATLASILLGIISTVVIGLQADSNKHWTKPIGLISTTVGAGMVTILSTFHIQEDISKLILLRSDMTALLNSLEHDVRKINETSLDQVKKKILIDDKLFAFSNSYLKLRDQVDTIQGTVDISKAAKK